MASFAAISAVGRSIERFLSASFANDQPLGPSPAPATVARLLRTEDFDPKNIGLLAKPFLSLFVYRVDFNKTTRAGWSAVGSLDGKSHLPVDIHFLVTAWANDAESELRILGRCMQALDTTPMLAGPLLLSFGDFAPNECVQMVLEDVSTEAVMDMFDSLPTDYKLSVPYIARVVRLDGRTAAPSPTVLSVVSGTTPSASP